jgi:hypothetical protein
MKFRALVPLLLCSAGLVLTGCGSSGPGQSTGATTSSATPATVPATGGPTQGGGGKLGPEGIPIELGPSLAPASTTSTSRKVDGIQCAPVEQLKYHIHAHLQVYYQGSPRQLPGAIGILGPAVEQTKFGPFFGATQCYYWLHTHTADGVIHIESPIQTFFTLGQFFDEWGQPLSSDVVATAKGPVTAFVDGKRWTKSPRDIPIKPHAVIQLEVGKPLVPFQNVSFAGTGL